MIIYENIMLKPKSWSSTNKFQKNKMENYIVTNNKDYKQIIKKDLLFFITSNGFYDKKYASKLKFNWLTNKN